MLSITCHIPHTTCQRSIAYFDPWYMLNNFCFHVYAHKSLFIAKNCNGFFGTPASASPFPVNLDVILVLSVYGVDIKKQYSECFNTHNMSPILTQLTFEIRTFLKPVLPK